MCVTSRGPAVRYVDREEIDEKVGGILFRVR